MKIIIETSDSERIALSPENRPIQQQAAGGLIEMEAIDAGPPRAELLQSLSERAESVSAPMRVNSEGTYDSVMAGGEPSLSRH